MKTVRRETALRKYTVMLPEDLVADAMEVTGHGITPTLREALEHLRRVKLQRQLLSLEGAYRFRLDAKSLRDYDDR